IISFKPTGISYQLYATPSRRPALRNWEFDLLLTKTLHPQEKGRRRVAFAALGIRPKKKLNIHNKRSWIGGFIHISVAGPAGFRPKRSPTTTKGTTEDR